MDGSQLFSSKCVFACVCVRVCDTPVCTGELFFIFFFGSHAHVLVHAAALRVELTSIIVN